ncbi:MAG TPA: GDP-mannose 4,6-dehydratase [Anaerolineae bacterium]|nr:GDP-mannose 4,6-dehydratase [Anaerolineae bacterium]
MAASIKETESRVTGVPVALITGANGFCARHLQAHLVASGLQVAGLDRDAASQPTQRFYQADVTDTPRLEAVLARVQPDLIFHLAALLNPRLDYAELHRVNALGTLSLLRAVRAACPAATVLITSTSAVYGQVRSEELPIGEDRPFQPVSAYGVSKVAQEMLAYQQFARHGQRVVRARAFNLTGPGESEAFVTSAFARQIAEIEAGRRPPVLQVGNLESIRDLTDVRDAVHAYLLLAESGEPGAVYNVCSGHGTPIRHILESLIALSHVRDVSVQSDPGRVQPADVAIQVGDPGRIQGAMAWAPAIPLRQTLQDVLDWWRRRVEEEQ